jgi:hypothetical protein
MEHGAASPAGDLFVCAERGSLLSRNVPNDGVRRSHTPRYSGMFLMKMDDPAGLRMKRRRDRAE